MADSSNVPQDRIRAFDPDGLPIAEFRAAIPRSFAIGDEGRAQFIYPSRKTNIVNEKVLQFGNWLLIENTHLPPWVGVIDDPRTWATRTVTVSAYTPERVLGWRIGPLEEVVTGAAGQIFERILYYVNLSEKTIIQPGTLWRGGVRRSETLNPTPLNKDLQRLQERSREEYRWRPVVDANGRLSVFADWMELLGEETSALLHEGRGGGNIEAVGNILVEDGPITNEILAFGEGMSWQSKPHVRRQDASSISKYGLRQMSKEYAGVADLQTLAENGDAFLAQFKEPARSFKINALNVGDTFKYMRLGNRMPLRFESVGFYAGAQGYQTTVRIMGMSYDPVVAGKLTLVVEEVL